MDLLKEVREQWAFYRDRRPDMYEPLDRLVSDGARTHHGWPGASRPTGLQDYDVLIDGDEIAAPRDAGLLREREADV